MSVLGVDVHAGYGRIDFQAVAQAGIRFAIVKGVEGNNGHDHRFAVNVAGARAAGLYVGSYVFGFPLPDDPKHPGRSPKDHARAQWDLCNGLGTNPGELPPVLDFEWPPRWDKKLVDSGGQMVDQWARWRVSAESIAAWGLECLAEMERLWGRIPWLYTYPWFWGLLGEHGRNAAFARYPLWIATYPARSMKAWEPVDGDAPIIPPPWVRAVAWQFSADGSPIAVPGIPAVPVDRNVYLGSLDDLRRDALIDPDAVTLPELPPCPPSSRPSIIRNNAEMVADGIKDYQRRRDDERGDE